MVSLVLESVVLFILSFPRTSTTRGASLNPIRANFEVSNSPGDSLNCWRICSSADRNRKNREECIKDCEWKKKSLENANNEASNQPKRKLLSVSEYKECAGVSTNRLHSCSNTNELKADVDVDFKKKAPDVYVSWRPLNQDYNCGRNWTSYALIYYQEGDPAVMIPCKLVPKNRTDWTISGYLKSQNKLYVAVVQFPYMYSEVRKLFKRFDPLIEERRALPRFAPEFPTTARPQLVIVGSIAGGLIAGLVLLIILVVAIMWRRRNFSPARHQDRAPEINELDFLPAAPRPNNARDVYYSCYYPESEAFRRKVASIVNSFRQSGYDVIMDVMATSEISSEGPVRWAECQVRKAKNILVFLSPGLVKLTMDGQDGLNCQETNRVWIELEVLRDLYTRSRSAAKMVCIALSDFPVKGQDLPLWASISYKWPEDFQEILKRLNNRPSVLAL